LFGGDIDIAFVWPKGYETRYLLPLSFAYLKSNLSEGGFTPYMIDCSLHQKGADTAWFREQLILKQPAVVCLSAWSVVYPEAIRCAKVVRDLLPRAKIIFGGPHSSASYEEVMGTGLVDFVLLGEAEKSFPKLLNRISQSKESYDDIPGLVFKRDDQIVKIKKIELNDIDEINPPDYEFIDLSRYWKQGYRLNSLHKKNAPLWVTRGCPYRCTFCSAPDLNGKPVRTHSIDYMKKLIVDLHSNFGVQWFNIVDDNFTYNVQYAKDFCKMVIDLNLNINFGTPNGIRVQRGDSELWQLMKKAGWKTIIVAPESGSKSSLARMRKDLDLDIIPPAVERIKATGLKVNGLFLIGFPGDTKEDLIKTRDFILKCKFDFFYLNVFQPLPGTPIYNDLLKSGEIKKGILPNGYSEGTRSYVTKELIGFNFPFFVLSTYLRFAIVSPRSIFRQFFNYSIGFIFKKIMKNFISLLSQTATKPVEENIVNI
jgi:radical SAM superfamily enzyme YgiQ (UPF0313 family)